MATLVMAQATIYPDLISVYIPDEPILRGFSVGSRESILEKDDEQSRADFEEETPLERSVRRTKKRVRDYILCNELAIFATFTFRDNRYDIEEKRRQMSNWLKNQQKRNGNFKYIAIPERHADGALHFHALLTDYPGKISVATNPKTGRPLSKYGQQVYYFPEYTLGFSNFRLVNSSVEDHIKVAAYVSKYITKDMPIFKGKKRYFCSQGLEVPRLIDNPDEWYLGVKPDWQVKTKNGVIMRFVRGNSTLVDNILEGADV